MTPPRCRFNVREEPIKQGYLSSDIGLLGYEALERAY
jgi:hypothetical protein